MRRHAVHRRAHAVLAHAEVQVASGITPAAAHRALLSVAVRSGLSKSPSFGSTVNVDGFKSAEPPINVGSLGAIACENFPRAARVASPLASAGNSEAIRFPAVGQFAAHDAARVPPPAREISSHRLRTARSIPLRPVRPAAIASRKCASASSGMIKRRLRRPAQLFFGQLDFLFAQRRAVRLEGVLLARRAVADVRAQQDQRRPLASRRAPRRARARWQPTSLPSSTVSVCQP